MTSANDWVNKQAVASAFSRAAGSYDAAAGRRQPFWARVLLGGDCRIRVNGCSNRRPRTPYHPQPGARRAG